MMPKDKKTLSAFDWGTFLVTTFLFLFSLNYFRAGLKQKEPNADLMLPSSVAAKENTLAPKRAIASAEGIGLATNPGNHLDDKFLRALSVPCNFGGVKEVKLEADTPFLRLNFFDCPKEMAQGSISVRLQNVSTGENILLFPDEYEKKITTNYFPLEPGENHLKLDFQIGKKQAFTKFITAKRILN